mmetsp:Transcript_20997/g.35569  ORF Transcript_20997/g.35569 Transcript_20997/m.35569 type:complete len:84 (+) Transcript_20997:585-836(+)
MSNMSRLTNRTLNGNELLSERVIALALGAVSWDIDKGLTHGYLLETARGINAREDFNAVTSVVEIFASLRRLLYSYIKRFKRL